MASEKTVVPLELAEWERFKKIMRLPMKNIKQEDLEWAYNQDKFNSLVSKGFFEQEIKRRKNGQQ